jgi:predicted nucleic acid-binding Zn ribbon protein
MERSGIYKGGLQPSAIAGDNGIVSGRDNRNSAPSAVGNVLDAFFKKMGYDVALKEWEVVTNWPAVVGKRIAEMTACEKSEKGVLHVKVKSAAWRQELTYMKDTIKDSIIRETGCGTIKDILFY